MARSLSLSLRADEARVGEGFSRFLGEIEVADDAVDRAEVTEQRVEGLIDLLINAYEVGSQAV